MSPMPLTVFFTHPPTHDFDDVLRAELAAGITVQYGPELPDPARFEVLVGGRPSAELLDASPLLRTVIVPYVGIPMATRVHFRARPHLAVHNVHHNAAPTAELAVALLCAAAKKLLPMDRALRLGDWTPRRAEERAMLLDGRTVLILGFGAIGRRVARACRGLGMTILGVRRGARGAASDPDADELHGPDALHDLLARAHALVICLPETDATRGLVDAAAMACLPRGAVLVNVGRGPIVDQQALWDALRTGALRAAGLDVWYRYPKTAEERSATWPADHPFWELDNVVMSPHRGGLADVTEALRARHCACLLNQAARGEPLDNPVDLDRGY
jgi:phosphoglycerate dehydrogenase-like enzyme